jgi:hypothetical protein
MSFTLRSIMEVRGYGSSFGFLVSRQRPERVFGDDVVSCLDIGDKPDAGGALKAIGLPLESVAIGRLDGDPGRVGTSSVGLGREDRVALAGLAGAVQPGGEGGPSELLGLAFQSRSQ